MSNQALRSFDKGIIGGSARGEAGVPPTQSQTYKADRSAIMAVAMYHLVGAMQQLKSYTADGPTVYALTIFGTKRDTFGAASLAGPALDPSGLVTGWPVGARGAAVAIFDRPGPAGSVAVIVTVQIGRISHCVLVDLPSGQRLPVPCHITRPLGLTSARPASTA